MKKEEDYRIDRCRYYERRGYGLSDSEKLKVLNKTDKKRCAMCGTKLTLETLTVDHAYPLNKGGSYNLSNLIPLCEDCNQNKGERVILSVKRFPFLKSKYKDEFMNNMWDYLEEYRWTGVGGFLPADVLEMRITQVQDVGKGIAVLNVLKEVEASTEEDIEELTEFSKRYNIKYGLGWDEHMDNMVKELCEVGMMFKVLSKDGKLQAVVPLIPKAVDRDINDDVRKTILIGNVMTDEDTFRDKGAERSLRTQTIHFIISMMAASMRDLGHDAGMIAVQIHLPDGKDSIYDIIDRSDAFGEFLLRYWEKTVEEGEEDDAFYEVDIPVAAGRKYREEMKKDANNKDDDEMSEEAWDKLTNECSSFDEQMDKRITMWASQKLCEFPDNKLLQYFGKAVNHDN